MTTEEDSHSKPFKPKIYQGKRRGKQEIFMINKIMIKQIIKIDTDPIVEIGEFHLVVEYNMNIIIEIDLGLIRVIEETLGEETLEET